MTSHERTLQQLHPLGILASRPLTTVLASALPVYATIMTWLARDDITSPVLAVVAIVAITGSSISIVAWSSPQLAPFSRRGAVVALLFAWAALVLAAASGWMHNHFARDDWAAPAIGLVIIALSPFRPARELVVFGAASAVYAGAFATLQAPWFVTSVPVLVFVVVHSAPILAMSLGAAAFSRTLVRGLERWRAQATTAVTALGAARTDWIARSVQQSRITTLNQNVVPFFADVLQSGEVTPHTSQRATAIANEFRSAMIAEVDRGWLDAVVAQAATAAGSADQLSAEVVVDPARLAGSLVIDHRTAIRALVVALFAHPDFVPNSLRITVRPDQHRCRVTLVATVDCPENRMRSELAPYFAVMRILFPDHTVAFTQPALRLRFSYER